MAEDDTPPPTGLREDGQPYKDGNTRADGSYIVGKNRPSEQHQFRAGDGRQRGRRPKGTRNLSTDWHEELAERVEVNESGRKKTITKQRGIVKTTVSRAMKGSDRAAEIALRHASTHETESRTVRLPDHEIIVRWMAQGGLAASEPQVTDDLDQQNDAAFAESDDAN